MSYPMILAPLFVHVLLTLIVCFVLAANRTRAGSRGEVNGPVALREPNWPEHVRKLDNNYLNHFELPVLFYLLTVLSIITRHADLFFVLMAWVFVVLRIAHTLVHVTSNVMRVRGMLFMAGAIVLTIMWVVFIVRIMFGLP
jgi:hypothetical protein